MAITKRKFSFASLRLKTSSPTVEAGAEYDIDTSPPYSPTASEMERPLVHPQLIFDLRQACTIIVNETNPPDPDEEPDHRELLRKYEEERQAKYAFQAAQARAAELKQQKAEAKTLKSVARSEQRANEKLHKEYAQKVEAEARRMLAREAEQERRKLRERQAELRMGTSADNLREQSRKEPPRRYSTRRPPEDVPLLARHPEPRVYVPKHAAAPAIENPSKRRNASEIHTIAMEPLEPTHTKFSSKAKGKQKEVAPPYQRQPSETRQATRLEYLPPVHATIVNNARAKQKEAEGPMLDHIRASLHERPKTSAAATVDYQGPSGGSSKSTTRSNTEYDNYGRPTSTAVTSAIFTPGDEKRISYNRQSSVDSYRRRPSDDSYRSGELSVQARIWQEQREAIRKAEEKYNRSGRAARPGSKASKRSRIWGNDNDSESERPLSRTGSISESIRSGISYYMRPRASQDNMRSGRSSASGFSRPESRSSSMSRRNSNGWWRGAGLRRKGSWSSFRSSRLDSDEPSKLRKNGEPNLNRPLPALPGLDQYKETKTHIGQLMKHGTRGRKKEKTKRPSDVDNTYQQSEQPSLHVKKESISKPVLRNESMDRTLHRYRESRIMSGQDPQAHRHSPLHHQPSQPLVSPTQPQSEPPTTLRKQSSHSLPRSTSRTSHRNSQPLKSPKILRSGSDSTAGSHPLDRPPPMIRGPSWQKEMEEAVYPRVMDVNYGTGEACVREMISPKGVMFPGGEQMSPRKDVGDWERKRGLKKGLGRFFGGSTRERGMDGAGGRRSVAAR